MGKILLIEPDRILRQALRLFLFPNHEVETETNVPATDIEALKEYDLLIVDGSALRDDNLLTPEFTRTIQRTGTPTLWLEEDESPRSLKREKLLIINKPIERETFQSALDGLLSPKAAQKGRLGLRDVGGLGPRRGGRRRQVKAQQGSLQFIDLVDVVDEQSPPKHRRRQPGKSK